MWSQVTFAEWAAGVAITAFVCSFSVFVFFLAGALRTPRTRIDHDAALPLNQENIR